MSENYNENCASCKQQDCPSKKKEAEHIDFREKLNSASSVKRVIGIVSGKGGVGKSLVTSMMAVKTRAKGYRTAIMDADITGPSIPKAFGISQGIGATEDGLMIPATTATGIQIMSTNLILPQDTEPVIWRGPIVAGVVKQFWKETLWQDIDYMFIDMPPGTGDVPLTVFQSLPVDGIIIVTSPQELVSMIVEKAINMAGKMHIPVLGIIENMSYFICNHCDTKHYIYGKSGVDETADKFGLKILGKLPIQPQTAEAVDRGEIEYLKADWFDEAADALLNIFENI